MRYGLTYSTRPGHAKQLTNNSHYITVKYILCDLILDIAHEITKLIKKSPQREALFNALKVQLLIDSVAQVFVICACKMDYTCRLLG